MSYARLFSEAVAESVRDDVRDNHPELLVPGFWQIRLRKGGPWVPARTFWCDHEPGEPDNKLDRWPLPYLAGEIIGEPADALDIIGSRWRRELTAEAGLTDLQEYLYQVALCRHAADYEAAAREPLAAPRSRPNLLTIKAVEP